MTLSRNDTGVERPATLSVVHDIPGRLRLRLPEGARTDGLAEELATVVGVAGCNWSPLTRGLLVTYDPETVRPPDIVERAARYAAVTVRARPEAASLEPVVDSARPALATAMSEAFTELNRRVHRLTGGVTDVALLVALSLTVWALRELARGQLAPLAWSTALWYAHGLFRDYNVPAGRQ